MKTILFAVLCALPLAAQGTFNPYQPDVYFETGSYSGDQSILHVLDLPVDPNWSQYVWNAVGCGGQGYVNNPPTYAGYVISGTMTYSTKNDPSASYPQCYPIQYTLIADQTAQYPSPWVDHLHQYMNIAALGSLPPPEEVDGEVAYLESCSLIGANGYVGWPAIVQFEEGKCVFYA